jgi:hypothetical protein
LQEQLANDAQLTAYLRQLLLGFSRVESQRERRREVAGLPALEATVHGQLGAPADQPGKPMHVKAVVVRDRGCVYDFLLIARPEHYAAVEPRLEKFIAEFRLEGR